MGVEFSREHDLPANINDVNVFKKHYYNWNLKDGKIKSKLHFNITSPTETTLMRRTLENAGKIISEIFQDEKYNFQNEKYKISINVLEVMCGNCAASKIIYKYLKCEKWIATDLNFDYNLLGNIVLKNKPDNFQCEQMNSVDAVVKYGANTNVFIIISPPPCGELKEEKEEYYIGYGDYYSLYYYINTSTIDRFIIFIGEMGASDGSTGLYKYMMENPCLRIIHRSIIDSFHSHFGPSDVVEKELFIFQIDCQFLKPNHELINEMRVQVESQVEPQVEPQVEQQVEPQVEPTKKMEFKEQKQFESFLVPITIEKLDALNNFNVSSYIVLFEDIEIIKKYFLSCPISEKNASIHQFGHIFTLLDALLLYISSSRRTAKEYEMAPLKIEYLLSIGIQVSENTLLYGASAVYTCHNYYIFESILARFHRDGNIVEMYHFLKIETFFKDENLLDLELYKQVDTLYPNLIDWDLFFKIKVYFDFAHVDDFEDAKLLIKNYLKENEKKKEA